MMVTPEDINNHYGNEVIELIYDEKKDVIIININVKKYGNEKFYKIVHDLSYYTIFQYVIKSLYPWMMTILPLRLESDITILWNGNKVPMFTILDTVHDYYKIYNGLDDSIIMSGKLKLWH